MTTTTVLSEDTATIVRDDVPRFSWGAVLAGAVIAAAVTFFLIAVGAGLGLGLASARNASASGIRAFLTLGAIYFLAAQAFGLAVGGHVTGRLMPVAPVDSEEENFRADAHGLAVWAIAVIFGLGLVALTGATAASVTAGRATTPATYWADRLLAPSTTQPAAPAEQPAGVGQDAAAAAPAPASPTPTSEETLADAKAEAARLLTVDAASGDQSNTAELSRLAEKFAGLNPGAAADRVRATENDMRVKAKQVAENARKAASYIGIWTAIALLFGALVCIVATVSARWKEEHDLFGRRRTTPTE